MPSITNKKITILSRDLIAPGPDKLRLALGNSWLVEEQAAEDSPLGVKYFYTQPYTTTASTYEEEDPVDGLISYRFETDSTYEPFGVPRVIEKYEVNPYNVTMINPDAYVPNFKIPIRFFADPANSKGDLYWNKYWLGGEYDGMVYTPLINESSTFYTTHMTISLPYWLAPINKEQFAPEQPLSFRTFSVKANYPTYDEHVQSRIDYEGQLNERLLPNFNYLRDALNAPWSSGTYESGMTVGDEMRQPQEVQLAMWYIQNSMESTLPASNNRNIYFGTHWPMTWGEESPSQARENADRHQENIMFDQYYYQHDRPDAITAGPGDIAQKNNLLQSSRPYDITIEFTPSIDSESPVSTFAEAPVLGSIRSQETYGTNLIRDIIEDNNFSSKLLETLKDIEEGNLTNFPQSETSYSVLESYGQVEKIRMATSWRGETYEAAAPTQQVAKQQKFKSFDWLDMLSYVYNNPTTAVNDNFIFMGTSEIRHHTSFADNTTYRYIDTTDILTVLDSTMDHLGKFYLPLFEALRQNEYYTHGHTADGTGSKLLMETPVHFSHDINKIFMKGTDMSTGHVLAYRVDKFEATPAGAATGDPIQKFWFFNAKEVTEKIKLVDSQVKFGKHYVYKCTAYVASIGHKFSYTNLRLTKQIGKYDLTGDGFEDSYCVQFYNPYTQLSADQTFSSTLASPDVDGDVTFQTTGLSNYNLVATTSQDLINSPQAADMFLNIQPCIKILEVPYFEKTCGVYDNPSNGMSVEPFHFIDDSNRIGFSIKGDPFKPYFYPSSIKESDNQIRNNYLNSRELFEDQYVEDYSRSAPRYLEMYRISKKPTSFYDFGRNLVSRIDLRIPGEVYNVKDYVAVDKVIPNKTYYYVFRYINENGSPSWPSPIIEAQLVSDGGYIYSLFDYYDTSEFIKDPFEAPSISFKKLIHLEPNVQQLQFDVTAADFSLPANTQLDAVKLGVSDDKLWDKVFKIRLTSKKTGKKIDLNVSYDVRSVDMSSQEDMHLSPDDPPGSPRTFSRSTTS